MGWEKRGNGVYYYRKSRRGGRVVSEYMSYGESAKLFALLDAADRQRRKGERARERAEQEAILEVDRRLATVSAVVAALTQAALLEGGYHLHKGQWRRRRDGKKTYCTDSCGESK